MTIMTIIGLFVWHTRYLEPELNENQEDKSMYEYKDECVLKSQSYFNHINAK